jgi:hypothetical protein
MAKKEKAPEVPVPLPKGELPVVPADLFEQDAGSGFEHTDSDAYAIPFLAILQKGSPQCDEDDGAYIEGAKPGMLFNTVTAELYDGIKGVLVIPACFQHNMVEWVPREAGGGMRGIYKPGDPIMEKTVRDDRGRFVLPNGNYLADTRYHFAILLKENDEFEPVVISMSSTQIKKSRHWMTKMKSILLSKEDGSKFEAPMMSHIYRLTTISESNDQGSWKGWKIELDHRIGKEELFYYGVAKQFKTQIDAQKVRIVQESAPQTTSPDDDVPF